ncbi:MAG: NTP transferase domain-containing protein [Desulfobacteraceae bacterium]|nr:NTP transferase domain-containing protein [Desulfobacteraceae bacterium]
MSDTEVISIIMAAGRGSRMKEYKGNKTLLPLVPGSSYFEGRKPILRHILKNLPAGPKAIVVNHCKRDVMAATSNMDLNYCEQTVLNGTGGAILATESFLGMQSCPHVIITMGDVPFVKPETYRLLVEQLKQNDLVILGFRPIDKKQYGVLEIESGRVKKITEWKYWKDYPSEKQQQLNVCNSGIYAVTTQALRKYLPVMAIRPEIVYKEINGKQIAIEEYFITDLIEYMVQDGRIAGYFEAGDETETMGIDDKDSLIKAQQIFKTLSD